MRRVFGADLFGNGRVDDVHKLRGGQDGLNSAPVAEYTGDLRGPVFLAVVAQDGRDLLAGIGVYDIRGGERRALVHAHVQGEIALIRKAARPFVQLVAAHAQIQQRAVEPVRAAFGQKRFCLVEIAVDSFELVR